MTRWRAPSPTPEGVGPRCADLVRSDYTARLGELILGNAVDVPGRAAQGEPSILGSVEKNLEK